jgi:hypothetical protein
MSDPNPTDSVEQSPRRMKRGGFAGRYTSTIILGVIFLLLIGSVYLLTNNPNAGVINPTPTPTPLSSVWDLSAGTAQGLQVSSISQTVSVQIVNAQWQLTAPTNEPASQTQVDSAVSPLKKIDAQRLITNTAELSQYGLASPALTVTLVMSGVTPTQNQLLIGLATLDGGQYYVKTADKPQVYTILNTVVEQLKAWFTTPPKAEPTPTPLLVATPAPVVTGTVTTTLGLTPTILPGASPPVGGTETPGTAGTTATAVPLGSPSPLVNAATATPAAAAPADTATPLVNIGPAPGAGATNTPGTGGTTTPTP